MILYCFVFILLLIITLCLIRWVLDQFSIDDLKKKAVFITGSGGSFGRLLALRCAKAGMPVFASCHSQKSVDQLTSEAIEFGLKIDAFVVDITDDESVKKGVEYVKQRLPKNTCLWAVVNNAAVFTAYGPDDWCSVEEYERSISINTLGVIRTTQAFKPLIKESKGRIVTASSFSGRTALPGAGPYVSSKFAVSGYMDVLRQEMKFFGVKCSILEPAAFRNPINGREGMEKRVEYVWNKMTDAQRAEYGEDYKNSFRDNWCKQFERMALPNLDLVTDCYFHAITAKYPHARYYCGYLSALAAFFAFAPTDAMDAIIGLYFARNVFPKRRFK